MQWWNHKCCGSSIRIVNQESRSAPCLTPPATSQAPCGTLRAGKLFSHSLPSTSSSHSSDAALSTLREIVQRGPIEVTRLAASWSGSCLGCEQPYARPVAVSDSTRPGLSTLVPRLGPIPARTPGRPEISFLEPMEPTEIPVSFFFPRTTPR